MSEHLLDNFGRKISYLRLAVTDRCNLRCQYCMPAEGIKIAPKGVLLTYKEMYRITRVLSELGVDKVRLTGGEPFVRRGFMDFLKMMNHNDLLKELNLTTNGVLIANHIEELEQLKVKSINLSIDSLNKKKFAEITRRDVFESVFEAMEQIENSKLNLKLNVVVQSGINTDELVDFVELTKDKDIAVRFIEEMPFNGSGQKTNMECWSFEKILGQISSGFDAIEKLNDKPSSTSRNFQVSDYKGTFGIIPAFTRTICNDCNRIRVTATGMFKNCLFDDGVFSVRDFLRSGASNQDLKELFINTIAKKPKDGFVAEAKRKSKVAESMSTIGG
ncbi:GTP 3',8-cyclase MoaA [Urechidicola vernalis]|uniref:GTP 3',8-cyclase n=1 Tax=Urechidicola vernalis TaxID=3075600 RepID=A0ABU2Y9Q8_9FLAO|nr:GTP 3',8-cyclase MoaA [Urechidicola sp. P050]MDT0553990.1 GTP 3',8-cyclase MoaA [Urechidicola sp. P050]